MKDRIAAVLLKVCYRGMAREFVEGDDQLTSGLLVAPVALAACLIESKSPKRLSQVTGLPVEYVEEVIRELDAGDIWNSNEYLALDEIIWSSRSRIAELPIRLADVLGAVFRGSKNEFLASRLSATRGSGLPDLLYQREC